MTETVMSASIDKLAPALLVAQKKMSNAVKDSKNPFYKSDYATLNSVREASHGVLNEAEISVLQPMVQKEGKSYVRTLLLHSSGQFLASDTEVVCSKQNDPQAYGSAVSYARRYGLSSLVSLGSSDDDGEKAMGRNNKITDANSVSHVTITTTSLPSGKSTSFRKPKATTETKTNGATTETSSNGSSEWV